MSWGFCHVSFCIFSWIFLNFTVHYVTADPHWPHSSQIIIICHKINAMCVCFLVEEETRFVEFSLPSCVRLILYHSFRVCQCLLLFHIHFLFSVICSGSQTVNHCSHPNMHKSLYNKHHSLAFPTLPIGLWSLFLGCELSFTDFIFFVFYPNPRPPRPPPFSVPPLNRVAMGTNEGSDKRRPDTKRSY